MAKKCSYNNCKKKVKSFCDCKSSNFFCSKHIYSHIKQIGKHSIESLFIEIDQDQKNKALLSLNNKIADLAALESKLYQICSEIMENLFIACKEASRKIFDEKKYIKSLIKTLTKKGEAEREDCNKETLVKKIIDFERIEDIKNKCKLLLDIKIINIDNIDQNKIEKDNQNEKYKDDQELFFIIPNELIKINLDTFEKSRHPVEYSSSYLGSCKLQDNTFFVYQIHTVNCYIANLENNTLTPVTSCPVSMNWGFTGLIDDFVYLIRTNNPPVNEKYNLITKQWTKITISPINTNTHTLGGVINKKLCIAFKDLTTAYIYEPFTNLYKPIPNISGSFRIISHGYILAVQNIYKANNDDEYSWTCIPYNYKSKDTCFCLKNQYVFKRGNYLYFCNCGEDLFRFDIVSYRLENIDYY